MAPVNSMIYPNALRLIMNSGLNLASGSAKYALLTSKYYPRPLIDFSFNIGQQGIANYPSTPAAPTASAVSGGSIPLATYYLVVTAVNAYGETTASPTSSSVQITTSGTQAISVPQPTISYNSVAGASNVLGWNVYLGTASSTGPFYKQNPIPFPVIASSPPAQKISSYGTSSTLNPAPPSSSSVATECVDSNGIYVSGGTGVTPYTQLLTANWGATWQASVSYVTGQTVTATINGYSYTFNCVVSGTSGSSTPFTQATMQVGNAITDGSVTWLCTGLGSWANSLPYFQGQILLEQDVSSAYWLFQAQNAGTSSASTTPTWPSGVGSTVNDNGITWKNVGSPIPTTTNQWVATTSYFVGNIVAGASAANGSNNYLFMCVASGTSGGSAPSWNFVKGEMTLDGGSGLVWVCLGTMFNSLSFSNPSWNGVNSFPYQYGVYYIADGTNNYLVSLEDFGTPNTASGNFTLTVDPAGLFALSNI